MAISNRYACFCIIACLSACSSGADEPATDAAHEGEPESHSVEEAARDGADQPTPLAVVELSPTHRVEFLEPAPGALLVSETGSIAADPNARVNGFDSAAALYTELAGARADARILDNLRAADERMLIRRSEIIAAPPNESADQVRSTSNQLAEKHSSFLWGNQCSTNSFEGNYCTWPRFDRVTGSDSGWHHCTDRFRSTVFNHSYTSTTGSAVHTVFYWGTEGDFWDQVAQAWVQRGTWHSWYSAWHYVKATTGRTTGQVSPGDHDHCILRDYSSNSWPWEPCGGSAVVLCRID